MSIPFDQNTRTDFIQFFRIFVRFVQYTDITYIWSFSPPLLQRNSYLFIVKNGTIGRKPNQILHDSHGVALG